MEVTSKFSTACGERVRSSEGDGLVGKVNAPAPVTVSYVKGPETKSEMANVLSELIQSVKSLVMLFFVGFILTVTNPTTEDFFNFAKSKIHENGGNSANTIVSSIWVGLAENVTTREDFYFWSTYTIDTSLFAISDSSFPRKLKFVGVGKTFFPTSEADLRRVISKINAQ